MTREELDEFVTGNIEARDYPKWCEHANYVVGDKVKFNGVLYRCKQSHISIEDWIPTAAQALWDIVS